MLRNNEVYSVDGAFQVAVQLDQELLAKNPKVMYISDSGEVTEIVSAIKNGKLMVD